MPNPFVTPFWEGNKNSCRVMDRRNSGILGNLLYSNFIREVWENRELVFIDGKSLADIFKQVEVKACFELEPDEDIENESYFSSLKSRDQVVKNFVGLIFDTKDESKIDSIIRLMAVGNHQKIIKEPLNSTPYLIDYRTEYFITTKNKGDDIYFEEKTRVLSLVKKWKHPFTRESVTWGDRGSMSQDKAKDPATIRTQVHMRCSEEGVWCAKPTLANIEFYNKIQKPRHCLPLSSLSRMFGSPYQSVTVKGILTQLFDNRSLFQKLSDKLNSIFRPSETRLECEKETPSFSA